LLLPINGGAAFCSCDTTICSATGATPIKCCSDLHAKCGEAVKMQAVQVPVLASAGIPGFPPLHNGPEQHVVDVVAVLPSSSTGGSEMAKDVIQWLEWLRYSGVGAFHLYDCGTEQTSVASALAPYITEGYVLHTNWSGQCDGKSSATLQANAWEETAKMHGARAGLAVWRTQLDVGLFPLLVAHTTAGYLAAHLLNQPTTTGVVQTKNGVAGPSGSRYFIRMSHAAGYGIYKGGSWLQTVTDQTIVVTSRAVFEAQIPFSARNAFESLVDASTLFSGIPSKALHEQLARGYISPGGIVAAGGLALASALPVANHPAVMKVVAGKTATGNDIVIEQPVRFEHEFTVSAEAIATAKEWPPSQ
jgi:hypothetical protein